MVQSYYRQLHVALETIRGAIDDIKEVQSLSTNLILKDSFTSDLEHLEDTREKLLNIITLERAKNT